jgi:hypothetical protein
MHIKGFLELSQQIGIWVERSKIMNLIAIFRAPVLVSLYQKNTLKGKMWIKYITFSDGQARMI